MAEWFFLVHGRWSFSRPIWIPWTVRTRWIGSKKRWNGRSVLRVVHSTFPRRWFLRSVSPMWWSRDPNFLVLNQTETQRPPIGCRGWALGQSEGFLYFFLVASIEIVPLFRFFYWKLIMNRVQTFAKARARYCSEVIQCHNWIPKAKGRIEGKCGCSTSKQPWKEFEIQIDRVDGAIPFRWGPQ